MVFDLIKGTETNYFYEGSEQLNKEEIDDIVMRKIGNIRPTMQKKVLGGDCEKVINIPVLGWTITLNVNSTTEIATMFLSSVVEICNENAIPLKVNVL